MRTQYTEVYNHHSSRCRNTISDCLSDYINKERTKRCDDTIDSTRIEEEIMSKSSTPLRVFVFYRDLRLDDNLTLMEIIRRRITTQQQSSSARRTSKSTIVPIFIMDRKEWPSKNQYQFLLECLMDLDKTLQRKGSKLYILSKKDCQRFLRDHAHDIEMIGWNTQFEYPERYDFIRNMIATPEHPRRAIPSSCEIIELDDSFLVDPSQLHHKPFKKFTPFYRHCLAHVKVHKPISFSSRRLGTIPNAKRYHPQNASTLYKQLPYKNAHFYTHGGYRNAWRQLLFAKRHLKHYGKTRNVLSLPTSKLSTYLSLNVLSIRRVYATMNPVSKDFVRELYWRDFYLYVAKYFPDILDYGDHPPRITHTNKQTAWKKWKQGTTGIPIVDACMRQLNTTGYMHNRGRMIVASYLIKDLHIHFKYGERYFEDRLVDHNRPSNNGGWQWVNGSGVDSQPPYQKFNMLLQNKKYDPECIYIKEWLPHLRSLTPSDIFELYPR